jgi:uncharacterized protein
MGGFEVQVLRDCAIPVGADGAELAADVYLPKGAPPAPALITLLPYLKDGLAGILGAPAYRALAARGYACVLADFRGLGGSSGRARPPFDPGEAEDGEAAIAWTARQPWCDGAVGMWGVSHGAVTALRTAARRPPALKAVIAVVGPTDPGRDFVHPHGLRGNLASIGAWGLLTLTQRLWPPLHQDSAGRWLTRWHERLEQAEPWVIDLIRAGPEAPVWRSRAIDLAHIEVPTFCVGGWRDLFADSTLRTYEQLPATRKLLIGPWMHTLPDEAQVGPVDFLGMATRWWDRWLRDERNGIDTEPPVTFFVQGRGTWHHTETWPPPSAELPRLHLRPNGGLADAAAPGDASRELDSTVGAGGGLWGVPIRGREVPHDQHADDIRSLAFTTDPLDAPLTIVGRPRATLAVRVDPLGARQLVVKLADVRPDGSAMLITCGALALAAERDPDAPVELDLYGTSYEIAVGHRLRLVVAGGDFPRLWPDSASGTMTVRCAESSLLLSTLGPTSEPVSLPRPAIDPTPTLQLRAEPVYRVLEDRTSGAVQVDIGSHLVARTPDETGVLDYTQLVSATTAPDRPGGSRLRGTSTTTVDGPQSRIVVSVELLVSGTGDEAIAHGTVTWDGTEIFSRSWTT